MHQKRNTKNLCKAGSLLNQNNTVFSINLQMPLKICLLKQCICSLISSQCDCRHLPSQFSGLGHRQLYFPQDQEARHCAHCCKSKNPIENYVLTKSKELFSFSQGEFFHSSKQYVLWTLRMGVFFLTMGHFQREKDELDLSDFH